MRVGAERSGADTRTLSCAHLYRGGVVYDGPRPRPQSSETTLTTGTAGQVTLTYLKRVEHVRHVFCELSLRF